MLTKEWREYGGKIWQILLTKLTLSFSRISISLYVATMVMVLSYVVLGLVSHGRWENMGDTKKLDWGESLIADPPPAKSTTMYSRLVCQDRNLYHVSTAYLPSPAKPP